MDSLVAGLKAIRDGEDVDYTGAVGACDFDDNGDVKTPIALWKYTESGTETVQIQSAEDIPSE
jgi:hypothetical protein